MSTPKEKPAPRLKRTSPNHLAIHGLRCGLKAIHQEQPCGGILYVIDWRPRGVRGHTRYEITCKKCLTCDPNGWERQDQLIPAAKEYFKATPP